MHRTAVQTKTLAHTGNIDTKHTQLNCYIIVKKDSSNNMNKKILKINIYKEKIEEVKRKKNLKLII